MGVSDNKGSSRMTSIFRCRLIDERLNQKQNNNEIIKNRMKNIECIYRETF